MTPGAAYAGTFHKTGTVLMGRILRWLDRQGTVRLWRCDHTPDEPPHWDIAFHNQSTFLFDGRLEKLPAQARIVILVRDPRDVIVSSTRYHLEAGERWLHLPQDKFGGRAYQDCLRALGTREEQMMFELRNSGGNTVRQMARAPWSDSRILRIRLEDLMTDQTLAGFDRMFSHLGLGDETLRVALDAAAKFSLFNAPSQSHARGGYRGEWRDAFTPALTAMFEQTFPTAVETLGYAI